MTDQVVDAGTAAQAQPAAAVEVQTAAPVADATPQPVVVQASALEEVKAKFEAFVSFVEHGIEVLGADAEAELVALKDKYL
ncbi:Ig domain protein group 1 domain protein [Rouxiella badensis]|uniref:Ig domain protein group 1 domain protein n=1 Tax=Rouxiella badensis TaxID=1646377 RepID=UPI001D148765|nr:Ig domain protein group 1 domain protein [Rouxiella badensis]MCC3717963.1 Ig domain protein group 1 domain protein [Rouxiella badensis]MCC3730022.1 Ig domain protein group 1 domain protein [Rouxiella badensis]